MSLTLPIEALMSMQVSFKVGLPDGQFAFNMTYVQPGEVSGLHLGNGMTLHLHAVSDLNGVTLTLCTSGKSNLVEPENLLEPSSCLSGVKNSAPNPFGDLGFLSEPLTLDTSPLEPRILDLPDVWRDADNFLFKNLKEGSSTNNNEGADLTPARCSSPGTPWTADTPATSPSACSESSSRSAAPRPHRIRSNFQCPELFCSRYFTTKHTLSKHMKTHDFKAQKSFPCMLGCTMSSSRKHDRFRHEVNQHGRACEWRCKACPAFFSAEETLKNHKCKYDGE
ncbi:hypothetical protein DFH09DRAFT_1091535 [Mycena vulgaris]|nr:hypothetical protein DFH09DRAFT_1091535 [Mycena vulgaris]